MLDLDNRVSTGAKFHVINYTTGETMAEIGVDAFIRQNYITYYYPNGTSAGTKSHGMVSFDGSMAIVALNLTRIYEEYRNLTNITLQPGTIRICYASTPTFLLDPISPNSMVANVTVNFSAIVVDGHPNEWNDTNTLILVDGPDSMDFSPVKEANITAVYVATDNRTLFFRVDLEGPTADYVAAYNDIYYHWRAFTFYLDVNNDGAYDYQLDIYGPGSVYYNASTGTWLVTPVGGVNIVNLTSGTLSTYWPPTVNISWTGTSTVEVGIDLDLVGLTGFAAGGKLTIGVAPQWFGVNDAVLRGFGDAMYTVGIGGFYTYSTGKVATVTGSGGVSVGNANISVNTISPVDIYAGSFEWDPMGLGGAGLGVFDAFTGYYYLEVSNASAVVWPINITISYSDGDIAGFMEDHIKVFYYDKYADRYVELDPSLYRVDPVANLIYVTITDEVYNRSDLVLVPTAPPIPVGGKLLMPGGATGVLGVVAGLLLAASAFLVVGVVVKNRKK